MGDTVLDEAIDETGIEVIAGADGADGLRRWYRILFAEPACGTHLGRLCPTGIDEVLRIERNLGAVDAVGIVLAVHNGKVLVGATYDVCQLEVLEDVGRQLDHLVTVGGAVVDVVVEDGATLLGIFEEGLHLRTHHGVDGEVGAEEHHIVGLDIGVGEVQTVVRVVLIEDVFGVVLFVEEGQRQRRLGVWKDADTRGVDTVVGQVLLDVVAHAVVAGLTDKRCWYAGSSQ